MKKLFAISSLVLGLSAFFLGCEKEAPENEQPDNLCPVIASKFVPEAVTDSFAVRYPDIIVNTWFYKDSSSYCALIIRAGIEKLVQFSLTGNFIRETIETEQEQNGEHEDDDEPDGGKSEHGCKCELGD